MLVLPMLEFVACAREPTGLRKPDHAASSPRDPARDTPATASSDQGADDGSPSLRARLEAALAADPDDGAVLYVLARSSASRGETARALTYLERLAAIPKWDYPLDPRDFGELARDPGFTAVKQTLDARAPQLSHGAVAMELDRVDLVPEGVAWDPRRGELLVGSMYQRQVLASDAAGHLRELVPAKRAGLLGVLGLSIDVERDRLWMAAVAAPFIRDYDESMAGQSGVWGFDLATGAPIGHAMAPRHPSQINDVVALGDGRVVATDSQTGAILELRADELDAGLRELVPAGTFLGPNGIVGAADGKAVYVADFQGLHRVDADGTHARLNPPPGVITLAGIDGLDRQGEVLVGVQNLIGSGRIWALELAPGGRVIADARILDDDHPRADGPTTGVFTGPGRFWYLGNAAMQYTPQGMTEAGPDDRHVILELRVR